MTNNTKKALGEWAPYIAIMITVVITVSGATWTLSRTLGRLEAKVEHNALAIERNAEAIERNAQAIAKLQEDMARLTGQYVEHVRFHEEALASR